MDTIRAIIETLDLQPHPEGGYFKETYRSKGSVPQNLLGEEFVGSRHHCTSIYFLLTSDTFSAFHRINQDEIWHFYKGYPLKLHMISPEGIYSSLNIGNNLDKEELPQYVVPAKHWFAAEVINNNGYALVGCTVSPGFDFKDFVLPKRETLVSQFPQHASIINKFTRL